MISTYYIEDLDEEDWFYLLKDYEVGRSQKEDALMNREEFYGGTDDDTWLYRDALQEENPTLAPHDEGSGSGDYEWIFGGPNLFWRQVPIKSDVLG